MVKIAKPFITKGDESPAYWQIGNLWQIMATGVQTDNAFTLLDQVVHVGGGGGPVTHTHIQDEGLYVISGKCTFNAGGHQGLPGTPGTLVCIPSDCEHSFTVDEPDTHVLNFYLPAGFEQLLIGLAHPAMERKPPPMDKVGEMMPPKWLAEKLSEDYGEKSVLGNPFVDLPDPEKMLTKPTPGATLFPFTANAKDMRCITGMGGRWTVLASGTQTGGSYCLMEVRFRKGVVVKPRIYSKEKDEMFYVLSGTMTFLLGDKVSTAEQGSFIYIPNGTVYSVRVNSAEAHCLNIHTRSGFEELLEFMCEKSVLNATAPEKDTKEKEVDAGAQARLMSKIGLIELAVWNPLDLQ